MPTKNYLSKCTVLEVSYMHGSQWMSLGKDEKSAFKVAIDHQAKSAESDGIVLKVSDITYNKSRSHSNTQGTFASTYVSFSLAPEFYARFTHMSSKFNVTC